MSEPSATPNPGSAPGHTDAGPFSLRVPAAGAIGDLADPFEVYASDTLAMIRQLLRRLRSQKLWTNGNGFTPTGRWDQTSARDSKVRVIAETWGYGEFHVTNTGSTLVVPADGDFDGELIGTLADEATFPISLARLTSVDDGPLAVGHVLSDGTVKLDALATHYNVENGDVVSLAGMWPLASPYDSEAD